MNDDDKLRPPLTPDCCEVWPKIAPHLKWMTYSDWPDLSTMVSIIDADGVHWRVNYCPSCGAERRGVTMATEAITIQ